MTYPPPRGYLSRKELAAYLGVHPTTIDRHYPEWMTKFGLRVIQVGQDKRFSRADIAKIEEGLRIDRVGVK